MSLLGSCRHAHHVQHVERVQVRLDDEVHSKKLIDHDIYTCQWLDTVQPLPPPIARRQGSFVLNKDDCDKCPRFEPPSLIDSLFQKKNQ